MTNIVSELSSLADVTKSIEGKWSSSNTETYWTVSVGRLCILQALKDNITVTLQPHCDFYFNNEIVYSTMNKVKLSKGDTIVYYLR